MRPATASPTAIRTLLDAYTPGFEGLEVARPDGGLTNEIHFLRTNRFDLVLKVFDDETGAWKPQKERMIHAVMRELGIPVPDILLVDASKRVVPFAYSLAERIEGEALSRMLPDLGGDGICDVYRQLGDYAGRLHTVAFDRFGDVCELDGELAVGPARELGRGADGGLQGPFGTWPEMHREIVRARLELMRGTEFQDIVPAITSWFEAHDDCLDASIVPRLLHMDLHPGNVQVRDGRIVAILDVEESVVGHNEYDLMRTELGNFRDQPPDYGHAFMGAYTAHVALDEGYRARKPFYDLSRTLAWIRSLILHADSYSKDQADRYRRAARAHVLALLANQATAPR